MARKISKKNFLNMVKYLRNKALWVRKETLRVHKLAREIRIASCLSDIEIFVVLYYGKILNLDPKNIHWENRDRLIISKAHGAVSLYPILADLGFFDKEELKKVSQENSMLGIIPDCSIPGFEIVIGSLGHGLGVGCGVALALKKKNLSAEVIVLSGDGELFEGSVWEAVMFASQHKLDNLLLIVDRNRKCMLDYCDKVINLEPLAEKFSAFNWKTKVVNDGHNVEELYCSLRELKKNKDNTPKVLIANTIKGKGVPQLEMDPYCHVKSINEQEIDRIIDQLQ